MGLMTMGLSSLLSTLGRKSLKVQDFDKSQIDRHLADYQTLIGYWRKYPDRFIDYECSLNPDNSFHFYFVQRMILRIMMRYKTTYLVFSRGFSKSFISVMALIIKCILYPGANIASVADQKGQSASILQSKMEEIFKLVPALRQEIVWDTRGQIVKTSTTKDSVSYVFKNGSRLSNAAIAEQTRGQRFQSLLVEEVAKVDQEKLTQIIMPTLTVSRKVGATGAADPNESLNQSAVFITSAGYKSTYAYDKLIDTLCHMVADKDNNDAFILGGDWRIPVVEGLQPANFIKSQELDASVDEAGFDREFNSVWGGAVSGAFFNLSKFDSNRVINYAEDSCASNLSKRGYYVMGVDVGRMGDLTEVVVIKVTPTELRYNAFIKQVVNIFTYEAEHFEKQAINIKRIFKRYKCDMCVIDGNGIGAGLIDFLVRDQIDPDTNEPLYNFGVYNDDDGLYKDWKTPDTIKNALYVMKANAQLNSDMYSYCQTQMNNDRLKFLIDEATAKNRLMSTNKGKKMNGIQREEYLRPYVETSILKSQMANMIQDGEGANVSLKRASRRIHKDKLSALIYALYWVMLKERRNERKAEMRLSDLILYTSSSQDTGFGFTQSNDGWYR